MAVVSIRVEGGAALRRALAKLDPEQNSRIFRKTLKQVAVLVAANARQVQIVSGGGAVKKKRLTHRTHQLRDSIGPDWTGLPLYVEVGADDRLAPYGKLHEHGIGRMPKRPFMVPALKAIRPDIPKIVIRNWRIEGGLT